MDQEHLALAPETVAVMRGAVTYARAHGSEYVAPSHMLLALLDDPRLHAVLGAHLERATLLLDAGRRRLPGVQELPERRLPEGERPPFRRYDTLAFRSTDGKRIMWLDREAFDVFVEGARRADVGVYQPKHLALGYVSEAIRDHQLQRLLGRDPALLSNAIHGLA